MKFTTLTARFPGTCKRCRQPIAVGDKIRYGGKGLTYHLADDCAGKTAQQASSISNDTIPVMTPALAADIRSLFETLIAKPVSLLDYEPRETADDSPANEQPVPVSTGIRTFPAIDRAYNDLVAGTWKPATIDNDLF